MFSCKQLSCQYSNLQWTNRGSVIFFTSFIASHSKDKWAYRSKVGHTWSLYFKMSSSLKYRYTVSFFCSQCTKRRRFNLNVNKIFCFLLTVQILCWFVFNIFFSCTQTLFTFVSFDIGTMQRFYMLMVQFYCCQVCRGCSYTWISITY